MFGTLKRKVLTLSITLSSLTLIVGCTSTNSEEATKEDWNEIQGNTQGTTYGVILNDPQGKVQKTALDSILHDFDLALSTYIDSSLISGINDASMTYIFDDDFGYFGTCYEKSAQISELTNGAFDPTVFPLVKAWGFFKEEAPIPEQNEIDSLLEFVGFNKELHTCMLSPPRVSFTKRNPSFKLDFNAIAQGYSVDILAQYLNKKGIKNYYLEIGGEIVVKGKNRENKRWRIGIDSPKQKQGTRVLDNVVNISNKAIATSGNYRKFYIKDGVKYAHTIDPKTGKPVQHSLLSATVIANSCADADAYATAFMVMGVEKSMEFVEANPKLGLDVYLLYDDGTGVIQRKMTQGFEKYLK
ncbi:FAD:protein FMN transferase [Crocinitomicaceae bacterium]|nr:FAD:protein FMN transferase [Crocinitomicaceae bacterium]